MASPQNNPSDSTEPQANSTQSDLDVAAKLPEPVHVSVTSYLTSSEQPPEEDTDETASDTKVWTALIVAGVAAATMVIWYLGIKGWRMFMKKRRKKKNERIAKWKWTTPPLSLVTGVTGADQESGMRQSQDLLFIEKSDRRPRKFSRFPTKEQNKSHEVNESLQVPKPEEPKLDSSQNSGKGSGQGSGKGSAKSDKIDNKVQRVSLKSLKSNELKSSVKSKGVSESTAKSSTPF